MKNTSRRKADREAVQFEIASYREYRNCAGQYTDAYIRGAGAVKLSETEDKLWEQTIPLSDIADRDKKLRVSTYSEYLVELETYGIPTASLYDSGSLYGEKRVQAVFR